MSAMILILSFLVSWTPPFFFELFPPKNVKKVTQIRLKADGSEYKAGQTIRQFSPKGQLINYSQILSGPHRDSVHLEQGPVGEMDADGRVVRYRTPAGGDIAYVMSADLVYHLDGSSSYYTLGGDSTHCIYNSSSQLLSSVKYSKSENILMHVSKIELSYNKEGRVAEERQLIANKFEKANDTYPKDSLLESYKNVWIYSFNKKQKLFIGYKLIYNNLYSLNDTIEKHLINKKGELVKSITYRNQRTRYRNDKDSVCSIYKYEYY